MIKVNIAQLNYSPVNYTWFLWFSTQTPMITMITLRATGMFTNQKVSPTNNGMLGGLTFVHSNDLKNSTQLLDSLKLRPNFRCRRVLDLGCGIGRVSLQILQKYFDEIHLIEQNEQFLKKARKVSWSGIHETGVEEQSGVQLCVHCQLPISTEVRLCLDPMGHTVS